MADADQRRKSKRVSVGGGDAVVAATLALFEPVFGQAPEKQLADSRPMEVATREPIRVVGAPFVPNVNPRER
ncbi:hypothetical protein [Bradyrhizobium sp. AS23.2]|uniref:hypothetical protein n=1 Tax=Bradyrhizobium sp. AS23.2 TaxID=1680155 RepID=UPI001FDA09C4|nr:hypothetical protein [Bradyrhizobium sp. AS23.2]